MTYSKELKFMKAYINKILLGGLLTATMAFTGCVGDLDQMPKDVRTTTPSQFNDNPREYISGAMAKCYSGIAISGQEGAGSSDISGLDNGRSCWSRAIFMLNEMTTDACAWIWKDSGVYDLVTDTWATNNENIFGTYSRLYTHIAVCNDFLRLVNNLDTYGIDINQGEGKGISQNEIDQFKLEARALRDLSYFYVIDLFGNAVNAWDTQVTGEEPPYMVRKDLFNMVTADLEDVLAQWDAVHGNAPVVYGRIGKDAVEALLTKYYLNSEVFAGVPMFDKCWNHCVNIIKRHENNNEFGGLAKSYHSVFCANNDMFAPGGSLANQNEILWNIPYQFELTESYGGTNFLIYAATSANVPATAAWLGMKSGSEWECMHAREQFCQNFSFSGGVTTDGDMRTYIWQTDLAGFTISNRDFTSFTDGYVPNKYSNVRCEDDGTMPYWIDPKTKLNRIGVHDLNNANNYGIACSASFPDADYPVIRLAEVYLTAAEAFLRANGQVGNATDAVKYVNYVRSRAGLKGSNLWGVATLTLDNVLQERARELYWENCRRTDLVRYDRFAGDNYNWSWKNNVLSGGSIPAHMNLYPIPTSVINSYKTPYPQNPGY